MCPNFQSKRTTLTFLAESCPKIDLGLEIQKNNVGVRISVLETPRVRIFRQKGISLTFLAQICPKIDLGLEIQKINVGIK